MLALQDNIKKYETKNGEIKVGNTSSVTHSQFKLNKDKLPN